MKPEEMKARTRAFALRVIRLAESFPNTPTANVIRNQMLRCGTSVGRITEPLAERGQSLTSSRRWG